MEEIWKDIEGLVGRYEVSSLGRIRNFVSKKIRKPQDNGSGYKYFGYKDENGKSKNMYIHRAVAHAFIDNPNGYNEVNHKDHIRHNNNFKNLEFVSRVENIRHSHKHKRHPERTSAKKIVCINDGKEFNYVVDAARYYNIDPSTVTSICKGRLHAAKKNIVFFYKDFVPSEGEWPNIIKRAARASAVTNNKKVKCLQNDKIYDSIAEAAKSLGLHASNISAQILGKIKQTGGYSFLLID